MGDLAPFHCLELGSWPDFTYTAYGSGDEIDRILVVAGDKLDVALMPASVLKGGWRVGMGGNALVKTVHHSAFNEPPLVVGDLPFIVRQVHYRNDEAVLNRLGEGFGDC